MPQNPCAEGSEHPPLQSLPHPRQAIDLLSAEVKLTINSLEDSLLL